MTMAVVTGYVYFIGHPEEGPVKIGVSGDPERRLRHLQAGSPVRLTILGRFHAEDSFAAEDELHERFASTRSHGEWFERTPDLLALIDLCQDLKRGSALPDPNRDAKVFTINEASRVLGVSIDAMRKRAYRLKAQPVGKRGNALLYRLGDLN